MYTYSGTEHPSVWALKTDDNVQLLHLTYDPSNTRHSPNVGFMLFKTVANSPANNDVHWILSKCLGQRRRRWPNIKTILDHYLVFAGLYDVLENAM